MLEAKVGSSAKYCVLVFKASLLWYRGPVDKIGSSAKLCGTGMQDICVLIWGVHQPKKVHLPNLTTRCQ